MISIEIQDERGNTIHQFADPNVMAAIFEVAPATTPYLSDIDPYGDTTFNALQVPKVIGQLRALNVSAATRGRVERLIGFLAQVEAEPHLYAKFIGD